MWFLRAPFKRKYIITYRVWKWSVESTYTIDTRAYDIAELLEFIYSKHPDRRYFLVDFIYCEFDLIGIYRNLCIDWFWKKYVDK